MNSSNGPFSCSKTIESPQQRRIFVERPGLTADLKTQRRIEPSNSRLRGRY